MSDTSIFEANANRSLSEYKGPTGGAVEVLQKLLRAYSGGNLDDLVELLADDMVMEFPFAPPERPHRVEGKENIIAYNKMIMGIANITGFKDFEIYQTTDTDCVILEMTSQGTVIATGAPFERRYIDILRTKNGRIQYIRDYWNPQESPSRGDL